MIVMMFLRLRHTIEAIPLLENCSTKNRSIFCADINAQCYIACLLYSYLLCNIVCNSVFHLHYIVISEA